MKKKKIDPIIIIGIIVALFFILQTKLPGRSALVTPGSNTLLYLPLDGNLNDISSHSHSNGKIINSGSSQNFTEGYSGQGYLSDYFNGKAYTDSIKIDLTTNPIVYSSNKLTYEAYVNFIKTPAESCLDTNGTDSAGIIMGQHRLTILPNNGLQVRFKSTDGTETTWYSTTPYNFKANVWYKTDMTYDATASKCNIYINGIFFANITTSTLGQLHSDDSTISIGEYTAGNDCFDGIIDEVRIYDSILSTMQTSEYSPLIGVAKLYPYPFYAKPTENLFASYELSNRDGTPLDKGTTVKWYKQGLLSTQIASDTSHVVFGMNFDINDTGKAASNAFDDIYGKQYTPVGQITITAMHTGKFYESAIFDGNSYIPVANIANHTTVALWYKPDGGAWTHVVTSNGVTYVNGVVGTPSGYPVFFTGSEMDIGKTNSNSFFKGIIDEVYVWDKVMSPEEVKDLYLHTHRIRENEFWLSNTNYHVGDKIYAVICPKRGGQAGSCLTTETVEIKDYIVAGHPYLFYNNDEIQSLKAKVQTGIPADVWNGMISKCNSYVSWSNALSSKSISCNYDGSPYCTESQSVYISDLAFCYSMTGSDQYKQGLINYLDWVSSWRHRDDKERLQTGIGQMGFAIGYDAVYNQLTDYQRHKYRDAFATELIAEADLNYDYADINYLHYSGSDINYAPGKMSNWEVITWGGFEAMTMALNKELSTFDRYDTLGRGHVVNYYTYMYGPEGDTAEPYHYYEYANVVGLPALYMLRHNGYDYTRVANMSGSVTYAIWMTEPFSSNTNSVKMGMPINDGYKRGSPYQDTMVELANMYDNHLAMWQWNTNTYFKGTSVFTEMMIILNYNDSITPLAPDFPKARQFTDFHDMVVMRDNFFSTQSYQFATYTGGYYYSHSQQGVGTFVLNAYGQRLVADAGKGENNDYLGDDWYYSLSNMAHNIVLIDGQGTYTGGAGGLKVGSYLPEGEFRGPESLIGDAVVFHSDDKYSFTTVDVKTAYDKNPKTPQLSTGYRNFLTVWNNGAPFLIDVDVLIPQDGQSHVWSYLLHSDAPGIIKPDTDNTWKFDRTNSELFVNMITPVPDSSAIRDTTALNNYSCDELTINKTGDSGIFFVVLYPKDKLMTIPTISPVSTNTYTGATIGNEVVLYKTTSADIDYVGLKTDAEIVSYNSASHSYFVKEATYMTYNGKTVFSSGRGTRSGLISDNSNANTGGGGGQVTHTTSSNTTVNETGSQEPEPVKDNNMWILIVTAAAVIGYYLLTKKKGRRRR